MHGISSPYPAPLLYLQLLLQKPCYCYFLPQGKKLQGGYSCFLEEALCLDFCNLKKSCVLVAQLTGLSISTMQDREHYMTISPPTLSIKFIHSNLNIVEMIIISKYSEPPR